MAIINLGVERLPDPLEQQYRKLQIEGLKRKLNPTKWEKFIKGLHETKPLWEPLYNIGTQALGQYAGGKLSAKFGDIARAKIAKSYEGLGKSPEEAAGLAGLSEGLQQLYARQQPRQQEQERQFAMKKQLQDDRIAAQRQLQDDRIEVQRQLQDEKLGIAGEKRQKKIESARRRIRSSVAIIGRKFTKALASKKDLIQSRRKIIDILASGLETPEKIAQALSQSGLQPTEIEVLMGQELTKEIAAYFLEKSDNNLEKAKQLARRFGYEVQ